MLAQFTQLLDTVGEYGPAVLATVFAVAAVEALFGLGVFVPAETALVLAAVALADTPLLAAAVIAAAAGAFVGDHLGYGIGRKLGPRAAETAAVRRLGPQRWEEAMRFVRRRGVGLIVVARLLPGVRTLVSAAGGAARLRYARFAIATAIASVAWSMLWVLGGAWIGSALLRLVDDATVPVLAVAAVLTVGFLVFRRTRRSA
ncbi:DedA family protein [Glycomyces tenuis]|uniref:DedA family protein n=1 Tax=Glycomyces tenuis TaxID=58116 RepID=UPI00040B5F9A|nr:DedA family protein [Glycomyces tenuis]